MTRMLAPVLLALVLALPASAETRALAGFSRIAAENGVQVTVVVGQRFAVDVTGRDAQYVRTRVDGGTLRISRELPWFGIGFHNFDGRVRIAMPSLEAASVARGATLAATNVNAGELDLSAAMGGTIDIAGACHALDASVSMGGVLSAENLHCDSAAISASMGGTADVFAQHDYSASASMGGSINVSGNGARGNVSTSMGGSVSQD